MGFEFKAALPATVEKAFAKALFAAKEQMLTDCNYYCRVDQGTLVSSSTATAQGMTVTLSWDTPYARRVYYTGRPSHDVNPQASLMWAQKAADTFGGDWAKILEKGMNEQ